MKRLLLSTTLILGTLTGVMGAADQDLNPIYQTLHELGQSAPNWDQVKAHSKTLKNSLPKIDEAVFFAPNQLLMKY